MEASVEEALGTVSPVTFSLALVVSPIKICHKSQLLTSVNVASFAKKFLHASPRISHWPGWTLIPETREHTQKRRPWEGGDRA